MRLLPISRIGGTCCCYLAGHPVHDEASGTARATHEHGEETNYTLIALKVDAHIKKRDMIDFRNALFNSTPQISSV